MLDVALILPLGSANRLAWLTSNQGPVARDAEAPASDQYLTSESDDAE